MDNNLWPWGITLVVGFIAFTTVDGKMKEIKILEDKLAATKVEIESAKNKAISLIDEVKVTCEKDIAEANKLIKVANRREAKVKVSFHKGFVDNGDVATFRNDSGQVAVITAELERPSSGKKRSLEMTFDPHTSREFGESEGWAFISGDTVTIYQDNHKSIIYTNP